MAINQGKHRSFKKGFMEIKPRRTAADYGAPVKTKWVVMVGQIKSFTIHGPFDDPEQAIEWAKSNPMVGNQHYEIATIYGV